MKGIIKRFPVSGLIVFLLVGLFFFCEVQTAGAQTGRDVNSLVFQIDPMLSITGFEGLKISYINQPNSDRFSRTGAEVNFRSEYRTFETSENRAGTDSRKYDLFTRLHYDRLYSLNSHNSVSFYWGGGPRVGVGLFNDKADGLTSGSDEYALSIEIGAGAVTGIEWQILNLLSLYGEYGLDLLYFSDKFEVTEREQAGSSKEVFRTSGAELIGTGARIGVILRF